MSLVEGGTLILKSWAILTKIKKIKKIKMKIEVRVDLIRIKRMIIEIETGLNTNSILIHRNTPMTILLALLIIKIKMLSQITVQI